MEALKSEVRELTEAQQQLAQANAAIEAEQENCNRAPPVHWYSDPAALSSGVESGPEPWGVVPLPPRSSAERGQRHLRGNTHLTDGFAVKVMANRDSGSRRRSRRCATTSRPST